MSGQALVLGEARTETPQKRLRVDPIGGARLIDYQQLLNIGGPLWGLTGCSGHRGPGEARGARGEARRGAQVSPGAVPSPSGMNPPSGGAINHDAGRFLRFPRPGNRLVRAGCGLHWVQAAAGLAPDPASQARTAARLPGRLSRRHCGGVAGAKSVRRRLRGVNPRSSRAGAEPHCFFGGNRRPARAVRGPADRDAASSVQGTVTVSAQYRAHWQFGRGKCYPRTPATSECGRSVLLRAHAVRNTRWCPRTAKVTEKAILPPPAVLLLQRRRQRQRRPQPWLALRFREAGRSVPCKFSLLHACGVQAV